MASFSAFLHALGEKYALESFDGGFEQPINERTGFPKARVRNLVMVLKLVYGDDFTGQKREKLLRWMLSNTRTEDGYIDFLRTDLEATDHHWWFKRAWCVGWYEFFDATGQRGGWGSREVFILISATEQGYERGSGAPFVAPVGNGYEYKPSKPAQVSAAVAVARAVAAPGVPPHLPAPQPQPSPDHQQVHLTQAEWKDLIKGRWDDSPGAKAKKFKFLQEHQMTEFHVAGDPCTYRTDADGKVVSVYDAQKSYNVTGARKGYPNVPLTLGGEPTFAGTPYMYPPGPPHRTVVVIEMQGNRPGDFKAANEAAGLAGLVKAQGRKPDRPPEGYTWHHRDDFTPNGNPPPYGTCTMELVEYRAHNKTLVHYGACDQCNEYTGTLLYT